MHLSDSKTVSFRTLRTDLLNRHQNRKPDKPKANRHANSNANNGFDIE